MTKSKRKKASFKKLEQQVAQAKKAKQKKEQAELAEVENITEIMGIIEEVTSEILKNRDLATQATIRAAYMGASTEINESQIFSAEELFFASGFIQASESMLILLVLQEAQDA